MLRPLAGLLLLALATLSACGEEGTATLNRSAPAAREERAVPPRSARCEDQLGGFVDSLDALRDGLLAGLTYESYVAEVRDLRDVYGRVPVNRLAVGCLVAVGAPGERALNEYIEAANAWGDCLADASCAPESVEPKLQRGWKLASERLSAAQDGLPDARPR